MSCRLRLRQNSALLLACAASFLLGSLLSHSASSPPSLPHPNPNPNPIARRLAAPDSKDVDVRRCPPRLGKVAMLVVYTNSSQYTHATDVLWCYAVSRGYEFFLIQPYEDPLSVEHCSHLQEVMFRKHCVAAVYLSKVDWLFVLDGDTTVVNAAHCLEEFIDPEAELLFYERFFSAELMSGNYIARNSDPTRRFLNEWAAIEPEQPPLPYFFSSDNGALHLQVLRVLYPENPGLVSKCFSLVRLSKWPDWEPGYGAYLRCAKKAIMKWETYHKSRRKVAYVRIRMQPRAQSFCRDIYDTWYQHYSGDFMAHSVKTEEPFDGNMTARLTQFWTGVTPLECRDPEWRPLLDAQQASLVDEATLRESLRVVGAEFLKQKLDPLFARRNFHKCWPKCPDVFRTYH